MNKRNETKRKFKWNYMKPSEFRLFDMVMLALLIALNIVLERLVGVVLPSNAFSISFIVIIFAAIKYGPIGAAAVSAFGDFFGAFFSGGPNLLFTVTAIIQGLIYGFALGRKNTEYKFRQTLCAIIPAQVICSLLLNTFFLCLCYLGLDMFFVKLVATRLPQFLIMTPIQIVLTHIFSVAVAPRIHIPQKVK